MYLPPTSNYTQNIPPDIPGGSTCIVHDLARGRGIVAARVQLSKILTRCFARSEHYYVVRRLVCSRFHLNRNRVPFRSMCNLLDVCPTYHL